MLRARAVLGLCLAGLASLAPVATICDEAQGLAPVRLSTLPANGSIWIGFPEGVHAQVGLVLRAASGERLELTGETADPEAIRVRLPPLTPGERYTPTLPGRGNRAEPFVAGAEGSVAEAPPPPPPWTLQIEPRPSCAALTQAVAYVPGPADPRVAMYRMFELGGPALGSGVALDEDSRVIGILGEEARPVCVQLASVGFDGTLAFSTQVVCDPPRPDAGVIDAGFVDAGASADAAGGLASADADAGCGCRATQTPVPGCVLFGFLGAYWMLRRARYRGPKVTVASRL